METPLAVASLAYLTGYAVRVLGHHGLAQVWLDLCLAVTLAAWAVFIADYAVRLRLSGLGPLRFVRTHLLDTVVLMLPLLRPVRMVTIYDRVQRRQEKPRLSLYARVMVYSQASPRPCWASRERSPSTSTRWMPRAPRSAPSATRCGGPAPRSPRWGTGTSPR